VVQIFNNIVQIQQPQQTSQQQNPHFINGIFGSSIGGGSGSASNLQQVFNQNKHI
jgi:hypothetical protein